MKKTALILSVVLSLAFEAILVARQQPAPGGGAHLGTWELVSMKYGDAKEFSDYPKDHRRLKMITATHFTWVDYDPKTGKVNSMAGGPYSLKEGAYTETVEFVGQGMESYLGKEQAFTIKIDGDKLTQSGQLSDKMKIEEIWQRVK
jgi:hypothetical protein